MTDEDGFVLYSRDGCHLCERMLAELRALLADRRISVTEVDVDRDPELAARFGERIPVLTFRDEEICQARLDEARVRECLERLGA